MAVTRDRFGFKAGTFEYKVAERLLAGDSREDVIKHFFPQVAKKRPFIFYENIGGGRRPKDHLSQYRIFLYKVSRTIAKMEEQDWSLNESYSERRKWIAKDKVWVNWRKKFIRDLIENINTTIPSPGTVKPVVRGATTEKVQNLYYRQEDLQQMFEMLQRDNLLRRNDPDEDFIEFNLANQDVAKWIRKPDENFERIKLTNEKGRYEDDFAALTVDVNGTQVIEPPPPEPVRTRADYIEEFYALMMIARDFVVSRELSGQHVDFISTRALRDGCKAIAYGLRVEEVFGAVIKTWPADTLNELKIHKTRWIPKSSSIDYSRYPTSLEGAHVALGYVEVLAKARIPIFLVGPSGAGKSFMARDLAYAFDLPYGEIPITAGATPSWLTGAETISGYKSRPFVEIYENGGVFNFEEIDAADPNMILLVNNALANEFFTNPVTGKEIEKHENFIPVATANTYGLGANRQYTGRERLDAATLDRWRVGRIEVDYDEAVERRIVDEWKERAKKFEKPQKAVPK